MTLHVDFVMNVFFFYRDPIAIFPLIDVIDGIDSYRVICVNTVHLRKRTQNVLPALNVIVVFVDLVLCQPSDSPCAAIDT